MKKVVAMTIHNRTPKIIKSVFASFVFPGNRPDAVAVCYDRAPKNSVATLRHECRTKGIELRETFMFDGPKGFRCPSAAWNAVFDLIDEDHAFCISSDVVLAPHAIGKAYHMAAEFPDWIIVGRTEHCGPSYHSRIEAEGKDEKLIFKSRVMTSSYYLNPLGFAWLLPMKTVREIGGYSMEFMNGFCFEDNDFTIRMWNAGADIMFDDDVLALHMEHPRPHVLDEEKVGRNRKIFERIYGDVDYIKTGLKSHNWTNAATEGGPLGACCHKADYQIIERIMAADMTYGNNEPWRAIKA